MKKYNYPFVPIDVQHPIIVFAFVFVFEFKFVFVVAYYRCRNELASVFLATDGECQQMM